MAFTQRPNVGTERDLRETRKAQAAFRQTRSSSEMRARAAEIAALPTVDWKGRRLYTLRCAADFGNGPHDVNVPEYVLWSLIDLRAFRCPFH